MGAYRRWFICGVCFWPKALIHGEKALTLCCFTNYMWLDTWSSNPISRGISCSSILWISFNHPITRGLASCPNLCFETLFYSLHWLCLIKSWIFVACARLSHGYAVVLLAYLFTHSWPHHHVASRESFIWIPSTFMA